MKEKEAYQQKVQIKLDDFNVEIEELIAIAESVDTDTKLEYYEEIEELQILQNRIRQKLENLRQAGSDAWEDLVTDIDSAMETLSNSIDTASARFNRY
ncbi:MAG: coiled coil domain-containing protein [Methylophaga sp.]|nr:coiled coil domain-containing protein [Methylophaga sp.]